MKTLHIIVIAVSFALSACDRRTNPGVPKEESGTSMRADSRKETEQSSLGIKENQDHRSKEMKAFLNSQSPQWLKLGPAIRSEEADTPPDPERVRSRSLAPKGSSNEIVIDGMTIKLPIPASEITWIAVSPSSSGLVLERGEIGDVRDLDSDGTVSRSGDPLPRLNFESDRRWMLTRWLWLSNSELITALNRPNSNGDIIAESKLYYYNLGTKHLREIRLPDRLINQNDPYLEVVGIADRSVNIRTLSGEVWLRIPESP
jgi:hypothetical protein